MSKMKKWEWERDPGSHVAKVPGGGGGGAGGSGPQGRHLVRVPNDSGEGVFLRVWGGFYHLVGYYSPLCGFRTSQRCVLFCFALLLRATPSTYGGSQARG